MSSLEELARDLEEKQRIFCTVLLELIEAAKKQERERMVMGIEEKWKIVNTEGQFPYFKFDYGDWQALKGEK